MESGWAQLAPGVLLQVFNVLDCDASKEYESRILLELDNKAALKMRLTYKYYHDALMSACLYAGGCDCLQSCMRPMLE